MGHLGHLKEEYADLVKRLEAGQVSMPEPQTQQAWEGWREILEILYTPEEATIASQMPQRPASLEKVAHRVGIPAESLRPKLDAMCDKGLVMDIVHPESGKVRYFLAPPVVGFFEFSLMRRADGIPKRRMAEALHAYTVGDRTFAEEVFGHETVIGRAMVREDPIATDSVPDVLPFERATELVRTAKAWAVSICYCRHKAEHLGERCDAPEEVCLSLNAGAEFIVRREFGRAIGRDEALEILHTSRKAGLVQIADNVQHRPTYICNCCGCCCGQLQAINEYDLRGVSPSGFDPRCDDENCIGCSLCSKSCPITAISMKAVRVPSKSRNTLRPEIDDARCIGCGVCADACRKGAMEMVRLPKRPHVPLTTIERVVRMSVERGRLAHLILDQGESRGHRFINQVVQTLTQLPQAERLLAREQVRSRFVDYALKNVRDPSGDGVPAAR